MAGAFYWSTDIGSIPCQESFLATPLLALLSFNEPFRHPGYIKITLSPYLPNIAPKKSQWSTQLYNPFKNNKLTLSYTNLYCIFSRNQIIFYHGKKNRL